MSIAKSFEDRGVYLPFTTEYLQHARVRVNSELAREVLIPGLARDTGGYLVPWEDVQSILNLTIHDRALIENLDKEMLITSEIAREHALKILVQGYDGADAMAMASSQLERDSAVKMKILAGLMAKFCSAVEGASPDTVKPSDLLDAAGQQRFQKSLTDYGQKQNLSAVDLMGRLDHWVELIMACGLEEEEATGYLRKTTDDLATVADELTDWLVYEPNESVSKTRHVIDALLSTNRVCLEHCKEIYKPHQNILESLSNWEGYKTTLKEKIAHLHQLLDGWPHILALWFKCAEGHRYQKRVVVHVMMKYFPIMTADMLTPDRLLVWERMRKEQLSWRLLGNDFHPVVFPPAISEQVSKYPFVEYV